MKKTSTLHTPPATDALLEIGSEELPASFIPLGIQQLKKFAETSLAEHKIAFKTVAAYGTPRRLALVIEELAARSEDQEKFLSGPPEAIAKDEHGSWTPAALGFARKQNIKPTELRLENGKVVATLHIKGTPARQLLAELFPLWIKKLEFPKSMTWEPTHFRYPRPLRWLTALYGSDPVAFSVAGVRSSRFTYGLYLQSAKKMQVASASKYVLLLKNHCVLVQPEARVECIRKLAEQAIRRVHGRVIMHEGLLQQVANLVEHPAAIVGNFDPAYLELPAEVLVTCLEHHQKYFPVQAEKGHKLLPHFVGIRNGMSVHQEIVREGYERVLTARLADAKFFYNHDRQAPLSTRVEALRGVVFQQKLGSLFDKKERVKKLLHDLFGLVGFSDDDQAKALRVAELGKADLVTDIVREFPELQGIMARIYAQADGEEAVVAQALEQHYWPITLAGALPESAVAALVSLADKLDTLAGDFAVGLIPTGSADPYGLRRAAVGVIRILEKWGWPLELETLLQKAMTVQPEGVGATPTETRHKLEQFFRQRWAALLEERGYKVDEIDAVLSLGIGTINHSLGKMKSLQDFRKRQEFQILAGSFKRVSNIIRQAREKKLDFGLNEFPDGQLLVETEEKSLWTAYSDVQGVVNATPEYDQILNKLVPLKEPLAAFFEKTMVMVDDVSICNNRLRLLNKICSLFNGVADFSKLHNT